MMFNMNDAEFYEGMKKAVVEGVGVVQDAHLLTEDSCVFLVLACCINCKMQSMRVDLERYKIMLRHGTEFDSIVDVVLDDVADEINTLSSSSVIDNIEDFECVKDKIAFTLVSKNNKGFLARTPHITYLNLAVVFYILVENSGSAITRVCITDEHLRLWNVNTATVLRHAIKNTDRLLPVKLSVMPIDEEFESEFLLCGVERVVQRQIYVATNSVGVQGAGVILYPDALSNIAEALDDDLLILPSSVHETLIMKKSSFTSCNYIQEVTDILEELNQDVECSVRLSTTPYMYLRSSRRLDYLK